MSRDARGNPGRFVPRHPQPRLRLADLVRRRRTTLRAMIDDFGVVTYAGLVGWCDRLGVVPPTQEEFDAAMPPVLVNSPQEGVIVLEPLPDDVPYLRNGLVSLSGTLEGTQRKPKRRKEDPQAG